MKRGLWLGWLHSGLAGEALYALLPFLSHELAYTAKIFLEPVKECV